VDDRSSSPDGTVQPGTALLNLLAGIDRPTSGKIVVGGVSVADDEGQSGKWR
jgi:ABC-type thiamine transport system ATPase subunit